MRASLLLPLLALAAVLGVPRPALAQKAIVLVRHAEKVDESKDPPLSPAGEARAAALGKALKDAGVTAIYTSEYLRTRKTAAPLAAQLRITPVVVPAKERDKLLGELRSPARKNDVILVVGHSDTVPELLSALGVPGTISIAGAEYDNLFVVVPSQGGGPPTFLRLRY